MDDDRANTETDKLNNIQSADRTVSLAVQDGSESPIQSENGLVFLRARWRLTILLFFTFMLLYMHRVNLSLAIVCMVKHDVQDNVASNTSRFELTAHLNASYNTSNASDHSTGIDGAWTDCSSLSLTETQILKPELDWDYTQVSFLLSAYFYGSFFTQVPAGRLADYFGGKHIITMTHILTIICSLLVPISARTNFYLVFVLRIVIGLAGGAVIPVGIAMLTAWAPPRERATMIGVSGSGFFIGTIISFLTSGFLCVYGFDNGWPSIFYSHSILSFILLLFWCFEAHSHPESHPRISKTELNFIQATRKHVNQGSKSDSVPWRQIFTSKAMWSCFIAHFAANWSFFTVLINVPLFLEEVLKYGVRQNGLYSALPYIFCAISTVASPKLAQMIINHRLLGHLFTRRLFTCTSLVICSAVLISTGYVNCERREVGVILLCIACFFMGLNFGGFLANHAEFSGQYSGTVYGITNAGGVISALLASMTAGLLTPNGLQEEWQLVFYISAVFNLIGAIAFTTCSSVELQPWAKTGSNLDCVIEVDIDFDVTEALNSKKA